MAQQLPATERKRVKVYELRENDWFDRGTGFCGLQPIHEAARIIVESEDEPDRTLLDITIKKEDHYQRQQETLIVWTDPNGVDMALSFQEAEGCASVWNSLNELQQALIEGPWILPPPELANLLRIEDVVRRASPMASGRDAISKIMIQENYLGHLIELFQRAEDLEDLPDLHRLCNIMKTLVLYNDSAFIEYIVRDEVVFGVVGALEYDPDFPTYKANHRSYLSDESKFKEVVPIQEPEVKRKIHSTYRLQYLKDVVLARVLDDPTFGVLNSLIFFNQVEIVQHICQNLPFLTQIFDLMSSEEATFQKKKDAVLLIQQSCAIAKNLQVPTRNQLYANFISAGLFSTITFALQNHDASVRVAGTDILVAVIDHDAFLIRSQIIKAVQGKSKPMTDTLIELLLRETDLGVKAQIADAIKVLLDPNANNIPPQQQERMQNANDNNMMNKLRPATSAANENFIHYFYQNSAQTLFQPLKDLENREAFDNFTVQEISTCLYLVEILCFFFRQHNYKSKEFILKEHLHARISQLLKCPEKHMKLTAVKYFRTCLATQDQHHNRQIIQQRLFAPILDIITSTMPRNNLLNSACLELFEFVRRENVKQLIDHLVDDYRERLESITYVDVFEGIFLRYEQNKNPPLPGTQSQEGADSSFMTSEADTPTSRQVTINGGGTRWQGLKETDAEEDAYFNTSDNDDDEEDELATTQASNGVRRSVMSGNRPLVDYPDDDSDEDKTPTKRVLRSDAAKAEQDKSNSTSGQATPSTGAASTPPTAQSPSASPTISTSAPPRPPSSLKEKRRRAEEDDEDELGKLSTGVKRRNSSTGSIKIGSLSSAGNGSRTGLRSSSRDSAQAAAGQNESPKVDSDGDWTLVDAPPESIEPSGDYSNAANGGLTNDMKDSPSVDPKKKSSPSPSTPATSRHNLRKTPSRTNVGSVAGAAKKISINLGSKSKENDGDSNG